MNFYKKVIGFILSCTLLLTSIPITTYADFNNNAGGGGSSNASGNGMGGNSAQTLYSNTSGYRITLVDPITGETKSKSIDILFSEPPSNLDIFTSSRVEDASGQSYNNWLYLLDSKVINMLTNAGYSLKEIPPWFTRVGNKFDSDGVKFKDWFLPESSIDLLSGLKTKIDKDLEILKILDRQADGNLISSTTRRAKVVLYITSGQSVLDWTSLVKEGIDSVTTPQQAREIFDMYCMALNDDVVSHTVINPFDYVKDMWDYLGKKFPEATQIKGGCSWKGYMLEPVSSISLSSLFDIFTITSYAAPIDTSINIENSTNSEQTENKVEAIPELYLDEEKGIYNVNKYGWALAILRLENNGVGIFAKNGESGKEIVQYLLDGEAYIIVEPILFFKPQTTKNMPTTFYGTPWNYTSAAYTAKLVAFDSAALSGGNIFRGTNLEFFRGLLFVSDEAKLALEKERVPFLQSKPYLSGESAPPSKYGRYETARYRNDTYNNMTTNALLDTYGLGVQLYAIGKGVSKINTYDIINKPRHDDTTETSVGKPSESAEYSKKDKNRTFQIAKFYRFKLGNTYIEFSHYNMINTPHTIDITDEINIGWRLKEWYTSESTWLPDMGELPSKYNWENVVKKNNPMGTYSGTEAKNLVVLPDDPDNTLYLLYEIEDIQKEEGTKNVIKVYENEKGETEKVTEPEVITGTTYEVPVEEDYIYTESKKSDNPSKTITGWTDTEGSPSTDSKITIDESTETIYILYQKNTNKQLKLYSNELSYTYGLTDLLENRVLFSIYDTIPRSPGTEIACKGHTRYDGCGDEDSSCPGHSYTCSNGTHSLTDSSWTIKVSNNYDYVGLTNYLRDYENTSGLGGSWSVSSSSVGGVDISYTSSKTAKPDGTFLLYRDKVSDLVTLYPKKNDSLSFVLSTLGIETNSASYTPHGARMGIELSNDSSFTRDFMTGFEYTEHENKLAWKWPRTQCHINDNKDSFLTHTVTSPADANAFYNKTNSIKEYYLLGQRNTGNEEVSDVRSDNFGTKYSYNKAYSSSSADLKFYPYHLMLYRAKNANNSPQNVYVTSENLSTMKVYNAVQLGVYKKNPINALLSSTQWSTHARSLAFSANTDKKSVLPGGAVLDLDMGSKGDTELGIRLWQSCLRDDQVETVQQDGFTTSLSKAKEIASNYQSEVKDVLEGYGLVQWGTEGVQTDLNGVLSSGVELHNNTSLDWDGRSYHTSNDSKYYLKHNGSGSDRANFDVLDSKITKQIFYEISSDVDGNVILKKDNTEIARASLSQDKSAILSNTEAKLLDDNTKLVSNYFSSIDRGLGDPDKYDRTNSRKYNEAYDGVGVLLTELIFDVGFSDNSGHRTTVLDTLLTSSSDSKSDLYNFSDEKVRSFVFATTDVSNDIETQGYMGTLKGDSTMQDLNTVLSDIQSFVYSKNFYTSNFNVTDLN